MQVSDGAVLEKHEGYSNALESDSKTQVEKKSCLSRNKGGIFVAFLGLVAGMVFGFCIGHFGYP